MEKGSIQNFLEKGFTNTACQIIFYGVSQAMNFLHKLNIINGRLKATNVLLNDQFHPILTDYFYNKYYDQYDGNYSLYDAPEITTNNAIRNKKTDVFSFGILMKQIISNSIQDENHEILKLIKKCISDMHLKLCKNGISLNNGISNYYYAKLLISDKNESKMNEAQVHLEESIQQGNMILAWTTFIFIF